MNKHGSNDKKLSLLPCSYSLAAGVSFKLKSTQFLSKKKSAPCRPGREPRYMLTFQLCAPFIMLYSIEHLLLQQGREFSLVVFQNFLFSCLQHILVIGIFPDHQIFQNGKKPFPLFVLFFFHWKQLRMGRRIIHQAGPDNSPSCCQRPPGPPQMQCRRMPMTDGFFPSTGFIDFIQWQCHLN